MGTPVNGVTHATIESKPIWKSATFWVNLAVGLAAALDWLTHQGFAFTATPWFGTLVALANIALRFKSQIPVTMTGGQAVEVPRTQG